MGDAFDLGPVGTWLAPAASIVGLCIVAIATINLLNGALPFSGGGPGFGPGDGGTRTPAPSGVVVVPDEAAFDGTIVYAKGGDIWIQADDETTQLTDTGGDSMPSWSPDGAWVYYIRSTDDRGYWPVRGRPARYDIEVPELMRIRADGSSAAESLATGKFDLGEYTWSFWIRQPNVAPDGTVAVVTDAPNPEDSDVVLQLFDPATGVFTPVDVPTSGVLGHQDPTWRHDGRFLLYVQNDRAGSAGAPIIMRYEPDTGTSRAMTGGGYLHPSWSPDGRYFAATRLTNRGTDVVVLDGLTGTELLRVTTDGDSFAPAWSPAGDAIAFLSLDGQIVDLRLAAIDPAPAWTVGEIIPLTEVSGLDPVSRPDWFIPADLLPATPSPTVAPPPATIQPSASP